MNSVDHQKRHKHGEILPEPPRSLAIPAALWRDVLAHLRAELPRESCGLLAAGADDGPDWRACRWFPGDNIDQSTTRYTMDPAQAVAAFDAIAAHGWRLAAIVHSHPRTPPTPSATDLREAYYPDALAVIVSFASDPPVARAWSLRDGEAREIALLVEPGG